VIVDAHVHIVDELKGLTRTGATRSLEHGKIQWGARELQLLPPCAGATSFAPETLLAHMDWAGVDRAVLLQGSFYGEQNDYVARAVARWPDRFVGAAHIDPRAADAQAALDRCVEHDGFRILKLELSVDTGFVGLYPDLRLDDERTAWLWEAADRHGLVVTVDLGAVGTASYQTGPLRAVLERHPDLRLVIAHLAQPPVAAAGEPGLEELWEEQVLLARRSHVWLDLSSLPAYAAAVEEPPYPTAQRYVHRAVELVGADRLLWGSDAPGLLSVATYPQLLAFVARHCDFLSPAERAGVLGGNAERVYFSAA
jgi:hypothetical protein